MPTVVTKTLRSSGGDYTLASAWAAALPADLTSVDEQHVLECYDDWPTGLASSCDTTGVTTDATRNLIIRAAAGHEHDLITLGSGFWIKQFANFTSAFKCAPYTEIHDIGLQNTAGSGHGIQDATGTNLHDIYLDTGGYGIFNAGSGVRTARNMVSVGGSYGFRMDGFNANTFENLTAIDCVTGFWQNGTNNVFTNCLSIGASTTDFDAACKGDYNASSDTSAPGANSLHNRTTADLADYAGGDYRTASGSALATAGVGGTYIGAALEVSGTPTVTGNLTATESTQDQLSSSGAVTGATITGNLTATESSTDTTLISGKVSTVGSLAVTETTTDTLTSNGTVTGSTVTGNLSSTETITDSFVSSGYVTVLGNVVITDLPDSTSITGQVSTVGTLLSTEQSDTFASSGTVEGSLIVSGDINTTEGYVDGISVSGIVHNIGSLLVTESSDTFFSTNITPSVKRGDIAITQKLSGIQIAMYSKLSSKSISITGVLS